MKRDNLEMGFFVLLLIAVTLAFGLLIYDFLGAIFWAVILALIFYPLHRYFLKLLNNRHNIASILSVLFCILLAIIPITLVVTAVIKEAAHILELVTDPATGKININPYVDQLWASIPDSVKEHIDGFLKKDELDHSDTLDQIREIAEQSVAEIGSIAGSLVVGWGKNAFSWGVAFCIMLYLLFFFFRDGELLAHQVVGYIPLSSEYKAMLFGKFATVIKATVKGNVVIAVLQGALGGLAFYYFGIQGALLWSVLMGFLSLLPAVGASLVWAPVAIYFIASGRMFDGIALIVYGVLIIGMVDNVFRPVLVGKDTKLPDYLVLISTLGGMSLVGITGFVVGPLIAALFLAAWGLVETQREDQEKLKVVELRLKSKKSKKAK